jgi:hypothetical protein
VRVGVALLFHAVLSSGGDDVITKAHEPTSTTTALLAEYHAEDVDDAAHLAAPA